MWYPENCVVVPVYWHLVLATKHISIVYDFAKKMETSEFAIWFLQEHWFRSRCFIVIFVTCALVLTKKHFTIIGKHCKMIDFHEWFIWLAREHYFSRFLDAPGGSWWLLETPWAPMAAAGGSRWKFMRIIVLLSTTFICHSAKLFLMFPRNYILEQIDSTFREIQRLFWSVGISWTIFAYSRMAPEHILEIFGWIRIFRSLWNKLEIFIWDQDINRISGI